MDIGIGVSDTEAFAAGTLPDPVIPSDQPARGWVWRDAIPIIDSIDSYDHPPVEVKGDIRSKRSMSVQTELYLILDAGGLLGTAFTIETSGLIRCLFALP